MAERIRANRPTSDKDTTVESDSQSAPATGDVADRLKSEIDDLLDEIDEVLETNSEEFVKNYVQKGGE